MHKHIKHSALCLALALPALSGLALAADDDNGQGLQLGIDAGQAQARGICDNVTNCDDTDTTVRADVGWQFNRMVGVELGYTSFGTVFDANNNSVAASQKASAITASVTGTVPIGDRFGLYGRVGAARYNLDSNGLGVVEDNKTKPYYGAGLKFGLTDNFALRAEWQRYKDIAGFSGNKDDIDSWSGGVVFTF